MVNLNCGGGDVGVYIKCDGQKLEEYALTSVSETRQQCYVASEADKPFSVVVKTPNPPSSIDHRIMIYLDGVLVAFRLLLKHINYGEAHIDSAWVSAGTERPFFFGKLQVKEDDAEESATTLSSAVSFSDLGTIRFSVEPVVAQRVEVNTTPSRNYQLPGDTAISEKSKKAGAHASRLGQERVSSMTGPTYNAYPIPGTTSRDIVFHYAPFDVLSARGILPRGAKPRPRSSATANNQASEAGPSRTSNIPPRRVKAEQVDLSSSSPSSSPSRPSKRSAEVVDLTLSSDEEGPSESAGPSRKHGLVSSGGTSKRVKREPLASGKDDTVFVLSDSE